MLTVFLPVNSDLRPISAASASWLGSECSPLPAPPDVPGLRCSKAGETRVQAEGPIPVGPSSAIPEALSSCFPSPGPHQGIWAQSHLQPQKCNSHSGHRRAARPHRPHPPLTQRVCHQHPQVCSAQKAGAGAGHSSDLALRRLLPPHLDSSSSAAQRCRARPCSQGPAGTSPSPPPGCPAPRCQPQTSLCSLSFTENSPETIFPVTQGLWTREHLISWSLCARKAKVFAKLVKTGLATSEIRVICEAYLGVSIRGKTLFSGAMVARALFQFSKVKKKKPFSTRKENSQYNEHTGERYAPWL